jgi:CBS domain-containing protein
MQVQHILRQKGANIISVSPTNSVSDAVDVLSANRIGAVLVCDETGAIRGILSERDIVGGLATRGVACLSRPVSDLMTVDVLTCRPEDTIDQIMALMTEKRIRHLPVTADGDLVGVISIGDVVKLRMEEVEHEAEAMRQYIATG